MHVHLLYTVYQGVMNWLDQPNSLTITNKLVTNQTYAVETVSYQGVVKLEGANVVSWNVSRRQRF